MYKILKIVALALALLGALFGVMIISGQHDHANNMLMVAYAVFGIVVLAVVGFIFANIFSSKQALMSTLKGIVPFLVLLLIAYVIADGTPVEKGGQIFTAGKVKMVNTGLFLFYFLALAALATMVWSGVKNMFKK